MGEIGVFGLRVKKWPQVTVIFTSHAAKYYHERAATLLYTNSSLVLYTNAPLVKVVWSVKNLFCK